VRFGRFVLTSTADTAHRRRNRSGQKEDVRHDDVYAKKKHSEAF
jgi:hypothetical protein